MSKGHLSETDIREEVMSTTRVEIEIESTDMYEFEIPTHVIEDMDDPDYMNVETPHGKDYWELSYEPKDGNKWKTIQIERGEVDRTHSSQSVEYKVIDKVAELEEKLERFKEMYFDLTKKYNDLNRKQAKENIDEDKDKDEDTPEVGLAGDMLFSMWENAEKQKGNPNAEAKVKKMFGAVKGCWVNRE